MLKTYRPDIDGLRGLAILLVVIYHFFPKSIPGGFIGVDIFFVISGYLITSIIFLNLQERKFNIYDFYARRIRRIFPPLFVVLLVVYALGWLSLFALEYQQLGKHIFSGALFFSNITLLNESGYFDTASELKPLLHLWSLAIEEQFYIFWPLVLILAHKLRLKNIKLVVIFGSVSFITSIYLIYTNPSAAFYFPVSRFWELLLGSFLAFAANNTYINIKKINKNYFSLFGTSLILFSAFYFSKESLFPGWWACIPVIGSALVILGKDSWLNKNVYSSKFFMGFGLISYGLYLWHWPILSFLKIWYGRDLQLGLILLGLMASIVLAALSYWLIEKPARQQKNKLVFILILAMIFIGGAGYSVASRGGLEFRHQNIIKGYGGKAPHSDLDCLQKFAGYKPDFCNVSIPNTSINTVILGDSIAHNSYPGLAKKYLEVGQSVAMIGWPGTQPWLSTESDSFDTGNKVDVLVSGIAEDDSIKNVILSMTQPTILDEELLRKVEKTIAYLKSKNKKVLYVFAPPHLSFEPIQCIGMPPLRPQVKPNCTMQVSDIDLLYFEMKKTLNNLLTRLDVPSYDPYQQLCGKNDCPIMVDGELLYRTNGYLSLKGSEYVFSVFSPKW